MRDAGLDEAQAKIEIAGGNNNNLRYAEIKEKQKSFLMEVKEAG